MEGIGSVPAASFLPSVRQSLFLSLRTHAYVAVSENENGGGERGSERASEEVEGSKREAFFSVTRMYRTIQYYMKNIEVNKPMIRLSI